MSGHDAAKFWLLFGSSLLGGCSSAGKSQAPAHFGVAATEADGSKKVGSSVCGFTEAAPLTPSSDGALLVPPRSALVSYGGRVDCAAPGGPMLGFVGGSVRVRFWGTGLELLLKDFGGGTPQTTNYYDVSVDGGAPRLLPVAPDRQRYELVSGLPDGEHEVELFKRGESAPLGNVGQGNAQVLGFVLRGTQLLPVSLPERRLEFIGDSITCGYGNELETTTPESAPFTSRRSNGRKAYGAVTAALLGARYSAVAYSGRGLSRNYGGAGGATLPELYAASVPEEPSASRWDPAQYVPHAVIINLGTNDFSTPGVDRRLFVRRYIDFLAQLRVTYPKAALVAALGPMLNDQYPAGENAWTSARADVREAVSARARSGDQNVHVVFFDPQQGPWGEDWHPTVATHASMAAQLAPRLKDLLGW